MSMLTISAIHCTSCEICVENCPRQIIEMDPSSSLPFISKLNEANCIYCGHCETMCPEDALIHSSSPILQPPLHVGISQLSAIEAGIYFRQRRSIRHFSPALVEQKVIEEIMDVVRYAPTGMNKQPVEWIIVQGVEKVAEITKLVINWMRTIMHTDSPMKETLGFERLIAAYESGMDPICRNAPYLFIPYANNQFVSGRNDAVIAATHLDLILPSFGLGGCWAGYLMVALNHSPELQQAVKLPENHTAWAAIMVGNPKYKFFKTPDRNKMNITWV